MLAIFEKLIHVIDLDAIRLQGERSALAAHVEHAIRRAYPHAVVSIGMKSGHRLLALKRNQRAAGIALQSLAGADPEIAAVIKLHRFHRHTAQQVQDHPRSARGDREGENAAASP